MGRSDIKNSTRDSPIPLSPERHYGFTEGEFDFIINYNIKYRMGDEQNAE